MERNRALLVGLAGLAVRVTLILLYPPVFGGDTVLRLANWEHVVLSYQLPLPQALIHVLHPLATGPMLVRLTMAAAGALGVVWHFVAAVSWIAPTVALAALADAREWAIPASAIVLAAAVCAVAALVAPRVAVWYRRTTVASRILAMCVAFLLPGLLIYPSVHFFSERTTRHLIETQFAVEAMRHPQDLQDRLQEALREIDAMPLLPQFISEAAAAAATANEAGRPLGTNSASAFAIWRQTVLARVRLANDVELYDGANDPLEQDNLAIDRKKNAAVLDAMNAKLNALIDEEVGEDVGQMMPGGVDAGWVLTDAVNDV